MGARGRKLSDEVVAPVVSAVSPEARPARAHSQWNPWPAVQDAETPRHVAAGEYDDVIEELLEIVVRHGPEALVSALRDRRQHLGRE